MADSEPEPVYKKGEDDSIPVGKRSTASKQSHSLFASEKHGRMTKRVIAPYARIERKDIKEKKKDEIYMDLSRFTVLLEEVVDLDALLFETAHVLKIVTHSTGVFVYKVDNIKEEIILMSQYTTNTKRHEVNIPIGKGKVAAAHVAATKDYLRLSDVPRDCRFAEGLKWVEARAALCVPVVKPDGDCHAVLEFYKTDDEQYNDDVLYMVISLACWIGAAVQQTQVRITMHKTAHLNAELLDLVNKYFRELASLDTMITDMLAVIKKFMAVTRSRFFIIDRDSISGDMVADMWDDGWASEKTNMPKKKQKVNLSQEQSPAGLAARSGECLNVRDVYKDERFTNEVDPLTGRVVRATLVSPLTDKQGVVGVVQLMSKRNQEPFNAEDVNVFDVFVQYCSLIVHFAVMQQLKVYHSNKNVVYSDLIAIHLNPCKHDYAKLMETQGIVVPPANFMSFEYYVTKETKPQIPGMICHMFVKMFNDKYFDRSQLVDFVLTILGRYRNVNPYHNAEHAFCFTHGLFLILVNNQGIFNFKETLALMLAGLCHDLDHPGYNNNFLTLTKHPLSLMYKYSNLEYYHYFIASKIIEDKKLLYSLSPEDQEDIKLELKYNILSTDLAVYFQVRAQLAPLVADRAFDWSKITHRRLVKSMLMTASDLVGTCKPFCITKQITECVYAEFYNQVVKKVSFVRVQNGFSYPWNDSFRLSPSVHVETSFFPRGDKERELGYTPLSMMDRRRMVNQPAEQIQFISVVVLPCLTILQSFFPNVSKLVENCCATQEAWLEEIEMRGQKLWRQAESVPAMSRESKNPM